MANLPFWHDDPRKHRRGETRLSELVAAAVRGEEVVLEKAGAPQVRLVAIARPEPTLAEREAIVAHRMAALGKWKKELEGSIRAALP